MKYLSVFCLLLFGTAFADGRLSDNIRIASGVLGYDLQYRVYAPEGVADLNDLPVLFITDGQGYIKNGRVPQELNRLIGADKIDPVVVVFVDPRDPDNLKNNRRNQQFFCNSDYLRFYTDELIPTIERDYPVRQHRAARTILGVSFGGLNAACFGLFGYETFSGIGMHSPANHPVSNLLSMYEQAPIQPLKIFLSTGSPNDNSIANKKFRTVLKNKGYEMKFVVTNEGHNWKNWRPLIDDVLRFYYGDLAAD